MKLIDRYNFLRLALYAIGIQLVVSQLVLLVNTFLVLRPILRGALPMAVFWDAYLGALPNVVYLTLPLAVAFAIAFGYAYLARDLYIMVISNAGVSLWRIAAPGLTIAIAAAVVGVLIAHLWAPHGANRLEDAKHAVRTQYSHRLLPAGKYIDIVPSRVTLYFKKWLEADVVSRIFLFERQTKAEDRIIEARRALFIRNGTQLSILFQDGHLRTFDKREANVRSVNFKRLRIVIGLQLDPALAQRPSREFYEKGTNWLLYLPSEIRGNNAWFSHARAELHKRLATPLLVLCYVPLIIGAAFFIDRTGRRTSQFIGIASITTCVGHIAFILFFDTGVRNNVGTAPAGYALAIILAGLGVGLIQAQNAGVVSRKSKSPWTASLPTWSWRAGESQAGLIDNLTTASRIPGSQNRFLTGARRSMLRLFQFCQGRLTIAAKAGKDIESRK